MLSSPEKTAVISRATNEDPQWGFRDPGFESKIGARFGIKGMRARWDAKYYPRDYGIGTPDFGSGLLD